ncbi:MAG: gliding motility-associated C-terminal domain-containing protein, partial [Flavobacteriales bacterium]
MQNSIAQDLWLRKAGGTNLDEATDISRVAVDGSYHITGYFSGNCNFNIANLSSYGSSDAFVAKYNEQGEPQWAKKFGSPQADRSLAVANDNAGNTYFCGFFAGSATFGSITLNAVDSGDVFVAKLNPQGDVMWAKQAGGNGSDAAVGIALDLQGNVIITGQFRGVASFGAFNLTSMNFSGGSPSADIFTAKLDNNGNWLWVEKGSAAGDERPTDVCTDGQGNIFICGQFSGDITFDAVHTNGIENAGYVVKYNGSGAEQWFSKIAATLVSPNALRCDAQNNLFVTGESIGQIIFFATNNVVVSTTNLQSIFIAKYTPTGSVSWAQEDGSDSYCSAKAISIGPSGEAYITGLFTCVFSEYADELGDGLFNSAGYRDVFVTRYSTSGSREWMRQYGGPRNDWCSGIVSSGVTDKPVLAGSFEKYFHVPGSTADFTINPTNYVPATSDGLDDPNSGANCGYDDYGSYMHLKAQANKDIFIGNFVDLSLPHFDYYSRGDCAFTQEEPCINDTYVPLMCNDSVTICGTAQLWLMFNTGSDGWIGPEYNWQWSNGSQEESINIDYDGWISVEVEREDGCDAFTDSIYVEILELPEPTITDDEGINIEVPPDASEVMLCAPDEVVLTGGFEEAQNFYWTGPGGFQSGNNPVTVDESGDYTFVVQGENGCYGQNTIPINLIDPLEEIDPLLQFSELSLPVNDTLVICGNDYITTELIDLLEQEDFPLYADAVWQIAIDTGFYPPYEGFESYTWLPQQGGWHYITSTPFLFSPEPCIVDTIWYEPQTIEVFIVLLDDPNPNPQISGGGQWCPGDTLLLTAAGANNYEWTGPGIVQYLSEDSVLVDAPGIYIVTSFEEYDNGCSSTGNDAAVVAAIPQPAIYSEPSHAVICPGDSLLLTAQNAAAYQWQGPLGQDLGNTQSIYVSQPGNYLCEITTNGCIQESNVIEAQQYATPYLLGLPSTDLCTDNVVTLVVQTFPGAAITWQPPLSGSSPQQDVYEPDTYTVMVEFCGIETEVSMEVTQTNPVATITPSNDVLCPGGSITLTANADMEEYQWTPGGQQTQSIIVTQPGSYTVAIADTNSCEAISNAFVIDQYNLNTPNAQNQTVCIGENANLFAAGGNVFWTTDFEGLNVVGNDNQYETPPINAVATYYVFAQDANCTSLPGDVVVSIYPSSMLYIEDMDENYCAGESFTIASQDVNGQGLQYNWTLPNGDTEDDYQIVVNNATPAYNGWYYLNAQDVQCESPPDSIYITVENPVNDALIADDTLKICVNAELIIASEIEAESYNWQTPLGFFDEEIIIVDEADYNAEGNYTLVIPGLYCATNTDTVLVDVVPYPEFTLTDTMVYCDAGYMVAHLPEGYDVYAWSNGDTDNEAIIPVNGFISVVVTNLPSCTKRDSLQVDNIDCISEFPNIFTPNSDNYNEYVDFGWLRIHIDEVIIFNRWGNEIKRLSQEPFVWNGRTEAEELVSDGVYYYVIISGNPGKHFRNLSGY